MRAILALALACAMLAGCNTIAGVGEDITGIATWGQRSIGGGY